MPAMGNPSGIDCNRKARFCGLSRERAGRCRQEPQRVEHATPVEWEDTSWTKNQMGQEFPQIWVTPHHQCAR